MVLDDRQRQIGKDNFRDAVRITRRQMLAGTAAVPSAAAMYWGYEKLKGNPVRTGLIGTGNQGCNAHIAQSNPDYIDFVAFCDIRPSSQKRARRLFNEKYGDKASSIKMYEDYHKLLERDDIELIIIALPLHLHAPATIASFEAGKHVLCEKLMAKTVLQCKQMVRAADKAGKFLAIGHQRHYSYLYANAVALIEQGLLGDVRHIRACWHRNQTSYDSWRPEVPEEDRVFYEGKEALLKDYGYESLEQLVRWRIDGETGGGLMVELGSHQLDAAGIFLGHARPKAVLGTGVTSYLKTWKDVSDHVFLIFEFGKDAREAVVTYSSISTNAFDAYGEQVMGSRGTMIIQQERDAYIFREGADSRNTRVNWAESRISRPTADSGSTAAWATGVDTADTLTSRGYREEQEHLAWLIRNVGTPDPQHQPRCNGKVALADAVVTLASNLAMQKRKRIEFKPAWFDWTNDDNPESEV